MQVGSAGMGHLWLVGTGGLWLSSAQCWSRAVALPVPLAVLGSALAPCHVPARLCRMAWLCLSWPAVALGIFRATEPSLCWPGRQEKLPLGGRRLRDGCCLHPVCPATSPAGPIATDPESSPWGCGVSPPSCMGVPAWESLHDGVPSWEHPCTVASQHGRIPAWDSLHGGPFMGSIPAWWQLHTRGPL